MNNPETEGVVHQLGDGCLQGELWLTYITRSDGEKVPAGPSAFAVGTVAAEVALVVVVAAVVVLMAAGA